MGLADKGLFSEGEAAGETVLAQTGRRTTRLGMPPFTIDTEQGRHHWRQLLLALEQRIVLAHSYPGMLADDLSDYLFARSTGHIGSLMTLINRGCQRAQRTGTERLTRDLLNQVKNDEAAEQARRELEYALHAGRATSRPHSVWAPGEHRASVLADPVRAVSRRGPGLLAGVPRRPSELPVRGRAQRTRPPEPRRSPGRPGAAALAVDGQPIPHPERHVMGQGDGDVATAVSMRTVTVRRDPQGARGSRAAR